MKVLGAPTSGRPYDFCKKLFFQGFFLDAERLNIYNYVYIWSTEFMEIKKVLLTLTVVSLLSAGPALALDAPENFDAGIIDGSLACVWDSVAEANEYSVTVEGSAIFTAIIGLAEIEIEMAFEVSFSTSDRTDGGDKGDAYLMISLEELCEAIASDLGISAADVASLSQGSAKVQAVNAEESSEFSACDELDNITF